MLNYSSVPGNAELLFSFPVQRRELSKTFVHKNLIPYRYQLLCGHLFCLELAVKLDMTDCK